jgi:hypothetical protein
LKYQIFDIASGSLIVDAFTRTPLLFGTTLRFKGKPSLLLSSSVDFLYVFVMLLHFWRILVVYSWTYFSLTLRLLLFGYSKIVIVTLLRILWVCWQHCLLLSLRTKFLWDCWVASLSCIGVSIIYESPVQDLFKFCHWSERLCVWGLWHCRDSVPTSILPLDFDLQRRFGLLTVLLSSCFKDKISLGLLSRVTFLYWC